MPQTSICRMCLGTDVRMITIAGTPLQAVYEKITEAELLDNMKPVVACYICLAQLRRCRTFMDKSVRADDVLNGILMNSKLTMKSIARIDRNSYHLNHSLSIQVQTSENQEDVDVSKVKKEVEFEFAGADEGQDMTFEEHTEFPQLNEPVVEIGEKTCEQPFDGEFLEIRFLKEEEKEDNELPVSDGDDHRDAESDDEPLRPSTTKPTKRKREADDDGDWKPPASLTKPPASLTKAEPGEKAPAKKPAKQKKRDESSDSGEKCFRCNHCSASFSRNYHLTRHISVHTGEKSFHCTICSASFSVHYRLKRHLIIHSKETPYTCHYCQRRFKRADHLKSHLKTHGQDEITSKVENEFIGLPPENIDKDTSLIAVKNENLEMNKHDEINFDTENGRGLLVSEMTMVTNDCYDTGKCVENKYGEAFDPLKHVKTVMKSEGDESKANVSNTFFENNLFDVHNKSHSDVIQEKIKKTRSRKSNVLKPFLCNECGAKFGRNDHLQRHLKIHSRHSSYDCIFCPCKFSNKSELKEHFETIHNFEEKYECDICKRKFTVKINLERHIFKHFANNDGERNSLVENEPAICNVCGLILNRKSNLKIHMLKHTGEKPFKCDKCHKSFSQTGTLASHLRIHTGIKPYECMICHHKFCQKNNLAKHMTKHSDEKPHKCNFCSRQFKRKDVMTMHMKIHSSEKPHACHICPRRFALKKTYKKHLSKHESEMANCTPRNETQKISTSVPVRAREAAEGHKTTSEENKNTI